MLRQVQAAAAVLLLSAPLAHAQAPLERWSAELASLGATAEWSAATPTGDDAFALQSFTLAVGAIRLRADEPFELVFDADGVGVLSAPAMSVVEQLSPFDGSVIETTTLLSPDLALRVAPADGSDTDMTATASQATYTVESNGATGTLVDAEIAFSLGAATADAPFAAAATLRAASLRGVADEGEVSYTLDGVLAALDAGPTNVAGTLYVDALQFQADDDVVASMSGLALETALVPSSDLVAPAAESPLQVVVGLAQAVGFGVLNRGDLDLDLTIAALDFAFDDGSEAGEIGLEGFSLEGEVAPERIAAAIAATRVAYALQGDFPQLGSADGVRIALGATGGETGFNLSQLMIPQGDPALAAWAMLVGEIRTGGDLRFEVDIAASTSETPLQIDDAPIQTIRAVAEAYTSEVALTRELLSITTGGDAGTYTLIGPDLEGEVRASSLEFLLEAPLAAAETPQFASGRLAFGAIDVDDVLWERFIDPNAALERSIGGLEVALNAEVVLIGDLLTEFPMALLMFPPIDPRQASLETLSLDALGLRVNGSGSVVLPAAADGAFDLSMTGWRGFVDGVSATPWGSAPDVLNSLLQADGFVSAIGAPGDAPDETVFEIRGEAGAWTINGAPAPF